MLTLWSMCLFGVQYTSTGINTQLKPLEDLYKQSDLLGRVISESC